MPLAPSEIERALVVTAHPDDMDFGCGGTVAVLTDAGVHVTLLVLTDGDAGGFDDDTPRDAIGPLRRREQAAAAAVLGVAEVRFGGRSDGALTHTPDVRELVVATIREVRPQLLICQSPNHNLRRIFSSHRDHRTAGEIALDAVYPDAQNPYAFPHLRAAGLAAWHVSEAWVMGDPEIDHGVDITDVLPRKVAALREHVSQTSHMPDLEGRLREWGTLIGAHVGFPDGRLAEGFLVAPLG